MNIQRQCSILILVSLTVGLMAPIAAQAGPPEKVTVTSAFPPSEKQGTVNLNVLIVGSGFDATAKVKFLVNKGGNNTGGITVNSETFIDANNIIANIDIAADALVSDFDIEVQLQSSGRKGKGTTLFAVKVEPLTCFDAFGLSYPDVCDCTFTQEDGTGQQGTPPVLTWDMQSDCDTRETLVIRQFEALHSSSNATLTAVAPFTGSAVFAALGHRAHLYSFGIDIGAGVDASCDPGELNSAIQFVLDADSADPYLNPFDERIYKHTRWSVSLTTISTEGPALCHAMEFSRTNAYNDKYPDTIEGNVTASRNVIAAGSYSKTGILFRGFGPVNNSLEVGRNTIGAAAGGVGAADANAIQFGPILGEGTVEHNLISLGDGTGVLVLGDGTTDVTVSQNDILGAFIGVLVDKNVLDVTFKNNTLTGDGVAASGDIGVCSDATFDTIRANKINDYDDAIVRDGCTALASPAD